MTDRGTGGPHGPQRRPPASPAAVRVVVPSALDGERIDRVVAMVTELSRTRAAELVRDGAVRLDQALVERGADRVVAGAEIAIDVPAAVGGAGAVPDAEVAVATVYADESVIVVDKPAGLVVHPGAGHLDDTLVNGLVAVYPELAQVGEADRPGIVHRLDRGTSGLLVVARTTEAHRSLVAQLAARGVDRRYRALVWGHPESPRGVIDAPVGRSARHRTKMTVTDRGKEARTRYQVEATFAAPAAVAEITCQLETGRTHQIRVHLAAIGHPVVGDDRYRGGRQSLRCPRPYLHAEHLGFVHPATGEAMSFDAALPADLEEVRARLQ